MSHSPAPLEGALQNLHAEDALWLEALHAQCFDERRRWSTQLLAAFLRNPHASGLAFIVQKEPAGFILGQAAGDEAEIVTLAVLPAFRRKGIAHTLSENFCASCRQLGKQRIFLEVAENNRPALALYQKLGFEKSGTRPHYYQEEKTGVDAWIMQKSLRN